MSDGRGFALGLVTALLFGVGILIGVLIEGGGGGHTPTEELQASQIGDPARGRQLFVSQGCSMCHSYEGRGGTDGPPLDSMRGHLGAEDIATMSGQIWNHVPAMRAAFREEHIPFPNFKPGQMADLIAYLHGGGPPPEVSKGGMMEGGGMKKAQGGGMKKAQGGGMKKAQGGGMK